VVLREQARLKSAVDGFEAQRKAAEDAGVLIEMADEARDEATAVEASGTLTGAEEAVGKMEFQRMLSGPYDRNGALVSINSGAGGTDAQDWAEMVLRMEMRWAEKRGFKVELLEASPGEEAGIKSATFRAISRKRRWFSESELRSGAAVCIIGQTTKTELIGAADPIGSRLRLRSLSCSVIGLLQSKGKSNFGQDRDDTVVIPLRTMQRRLSGNEDVGQVQLSVSNSVSTEKAQQDITRLMRERRHLARDSDDDFNIMDQQEIANTISGTTRTLTALLAAVAAISLLVGGIGIMNIMLVSVTERTREIGIRLAIGAFERDVLTQFLIEAVVLSLFGGTIGITLALTASFAAARALSLPFALDYSIIALAFIFSAAVGIVFGFFPARRAASLNPIDALRHE